MFQNLHYDTAGRMHVGSPTKIPLSLQEAKPTISSHGGRIYQIQKHILCLDLDSNLTLTYETTMVSKR